MRVTLSVTEGPEAGKVFVFTQPDNFLVGRTQNAHLRFDRNADRLISRMHFLLEVRPSRVMIRDLESKNGTFVNGHRITVKELSNGDVIRVGKSQMTITTEDQAGADASGRVCAACGGPMLGASGELCPDCQARARLSETLAAAEMPSQPAGRYACLSCGADLTDRAVSDGLAADLDKAEYVCPNCIRSLIAPNQKLKQIGEYLVLSEIGRGGMGVVYKVVNRLTRRICALKMILPDLVRDGYAGKVFQREIEVQSKIIHRNLVRVLDQGKHGLAPYFVTEYLPGGDVKSLVTWEFRGPLEPEMSCNITLQVLAGLKALHQTGFIHRDLKPSNYLLDRPYIEPDFQVKIADYGLAKSFENAGNSVFDYTREGIAAGSYVFIPPEQITNYRYVKPPVDVYAVGASLYFMLTSRYSVDFPDPFTDSGNIPAEQPQKHPLQIVLEDPPIPILERKPDLPPRLAAVVDKASAKNLDIRYRTADSFMAELLAVVKQQGWRLPRGIS